MGIFKRKARVKKVEPKEDFDSVRKFKTYNCGLTTFEEGVNEHLRNGYTIVDREITYGESGGQYSSFIVVGDITFEKIIKDE